MRILQVFLGALPLSNVLKATDAPDQRTFRVPQWHDIDQDRHPGAVGASNHQLAVPQRMPVRNASAMGDSL